MYHLGSAVSSLCKLVLARWCLCKFVSLYKTFDIHLARASHGALDWSEASCTTKLNIQLLQGNPTYEVGARRALQLQAHAFVIANSRLTFPACTFNKSKEDGGSSVQIGKIRQFRNRNGTPDGLMPSINAANLYIELWAVGLAVTRADGCDFATRQNPAK
jgi:hypothetical protein